MDINPTAENDLIPRPDGVQISEEKFREAQAIFLKTLQEADGPVGVQTLRDVVADLMSDKGVSQILSAMPNVRAWRERKYQGGVFYALSDLELDAENWRPLDPTATARRPIPTTTAAPIPPADSLADIKREMIDRAQAHLDLMTKQDGAIRAKYERQIQALEQTRDRELLGVIQERKEAQRMLRSLGVEDRRTARPTKARKARKQTNASREKVLQLLEWAASSHPDPEDTFTYREAMEATGMPYHTVQAAMGIARDANHIRRWGTSANAEALFVMEAASIEQFKQRETTTGGTTDGNE